MSKRKHSETEDATADSPRKIRVVDTETTTSTSSTKDAKAKAAARQAKSERRSKKADTKGKPKRKRDREEPSALPDGAEDATTTTEAPTTTASDPFANHDETIPLDDTPKSTKKSKPNPKSETKPPKTTSKHTSKNTPKDTTSKDTNPPPSNHRFILFIGNLPYTTTTPSLTHHFRALQPFTIRHSTVKGSSPPKSKGFAFLEFTGYDRMKTCLKLYHHSLFDPEGHLKAPAPATSSNSTPSTEQDKSGSGKKQKASGGVFKESDLRAEDLPRQDTTPQHHKRPHDKTRRINVELTAGGGGGKSAARKDKIRNKNAKLAEERERGHKREVEEREKKEGGGEGGGKGRVRRTGANAEGADQQDDGSRGNVHPSRLRRVRG